MTPLAAGGGFDPTDIIQFGVLGIVLVLGLFGWIWFKPAVDRLIKDKEHAEAQRDALVQTFQTEVMPVLAETKDKVVPILATVLRLVEEIRRDIGQRR